MVPQSARFRAKRTILEIALDDEGIQVNVARNVKVGKLGKP